MVMYNILHELCYKASTFTKDAQYRRFPEVTKVLNVAHLSHCSIIIFQNNLQGYSCISSKFTHSIKTWKQKWLIMNDRACKSLFKLMPRWDKHINVFRAYSAHVNKVQ